MKFNKQVLIALFVVALSTSVYAACANREKDGNSSDLYEDIKCGLSTAGDKIKDAGTSIGSSLKDGSNKALDVISKAAVKTGGVLRDGLNVAVESGKSGYEYVRDAVTGRKPSENIKDIEEIVDLKALNGTDVLSF